MAQQIINVGSAPNDGTGDVLRNSQIKANANFTELYSAVDLKLDKVSTVDVEKVYIKNADGTQGMKPTSELLSEVLSNDETTYTDATTPLAGTEEVLIHDGTDWKKVEVSELGGGGGSSFKGVWNAETNTPTLANGTGTLGDEYEVSVSGYQFGDIFLPKDTIYYNASNVWVKKQDNNQNFAQNLPLYYLYLMNGGVPNSLGETVIVENSSAINGNLAFTSFFNGTNEITCRRYYTSATANSITNVRNTSFLRLTQNMAFSFELSVRNDDTATNTLGRSFYGMTQINSIGNVDPSQMYGTGFCLAADSADTNMQILFKTGIGAGTGVTKIDTGWAKTNSDLFRIIFYREANSSKLFYRIKNVTLDAEIVGMFTYAQGTQKLTLYTYKGSGGNATQTGYDFIENKLYTSL